MQGFWNKLFTIWFESYQVGVSHVTSFCKTASHITSYLKSVRARTYARAHPHTHTTLLFNWWLRFRHICDQQHTDMCHTSLSEKAQQSDISVKGCTSGVEWWIRCRGATTVTTHTTLHSNNPTVKHNSKHYNVQTKAMCNTPRFISSLLIELSIQSMANNTDFISTLFVSCFAADIAMVVQTNWYCKLYLTH